MKQAFWETTPLDKMTADEWEALCDGCGKCCLEKFEDDDTGRIIYSRVACQLLDLNSCRCRDYHNRARLMPDCITLALEVLDRPEWLPETCAYRLLSEGKPLPDWHPLKTGDPLSVDEAGQSVRGRVIGPETGENPLMQLIDWVR
ncbi:YcgN family cysteine cluster protein [Thiorhodococcus mannitoliphagus]|uniref:UPF0260 protein G3480_07090 n=1 Tax=Thiorhodococcus mannitoliphagus TaxID=329406 RepID=A0A6P1DT16_9GAMM|nr:YcgN family cysteine cluster protein [Thiorhodococcus mannitoliphagus]NEX20081.1 YcgN family cysteine cluster protein [Thiorhodococcus mannitoliphagus]